MSDNLQNFMRKVKLNTMDWGNLMYEYILHTASTAVIDYLRNLWIIWC